MPENYTFADISDRTWRSLKPLPRNLEPMLSEGFRPEQFRVLISDEENESCLDDLGLRITQFYRQILKPGDYIVTVTIMNGAHFFSTDLLKRLRIPIDTDWMKVDTYGGGLKSKGEVKMHKDMNRPAVGKHVLVIEDIVDSGLTIDYLRKHIQMAKHPASISFASYLRKDDAQVYDTGAEFCGFNTPSDLFVVGYGLDIDHKMRNLPVVAAYNKKARKRKR